MQLAAKNQKTWTVSYQDIMTSKLNGLIGRERGQIGPHLTFVQN